MTWLYGSIFNLQASRSESLMMMLYVFSILPVVAAFFALYTARTVLTDKSTWFEKASSIVLVASILIIIWFSVAVGFFSFDTGY